MIDMIACLQCLQRIEFHTFRRQQSEAYVRCCAGWWVLQLGGMHHHMVVGPRRVGLRRDWQGQFLCSQLTCHIVHHFITLLAAVQYSIDV